MEFLEENTKGALTNAWYGGLMHHMDPKKFPKKPSQLWDDGPEQTAAQMILLAKMWAKNGHKFKDEKIPR